MLHSIPILLAWFAYLLFIHDPRALSREVITEDRRPKKAWSENIKFIDKRTTRSNYTNFDAVNGEMLETYVK